jgi:hypothetical protein
VRNGVCSLVYSTCCERQKSCYKVKRHRKLDSMCRQVDVRHRTQYMCMLTGEINSWRRRGYSQNSNLSLQNTIEVTCASKHERGELFQRKKGTVVNFVISTYPDFTRTKAKLSRHPIPSHHMPCMRFSKAEIPFRLPIPHQSLSFRLLYSYLVISS